MLGTLLICLLAWLCVAGASALGLVLLAALDVRQFDVREFELQDVPTGEAVLLSA